MAEGVSVSLSALSILQIEAEEGGHREQFRIMLDCKTIEKPDSPVDVVLVSQPDMDHIYGLVSYLSMEDPIDDAGHEQAPPRTFCLMTGAAKQMATMAFYSTLLGATEVEHDFSIEDVDRAFKRVTGLRYREERVLATSSTLTVSVVPYNSGRVVGGAIWRININNVHDIIYAVDYNHKKEMILSGCSMMDLGLAVRPCLVITSAGSALPGASTAASVLRNTVIQTLRNDGNVLIPVDASGRVLEILMILNDLWEEKRLTYPLLFVGPMVKNTLEFARCQLEWMNEDLVRSLGHQKVDNPLAMKRVTLCSTEKEALRAMQQNRGPAVVLAVSDSLDDGPSRFFFSRWAENRRNAIIVLDPKPDSLVAQVVGEAGGRERSKLNMTISTRVPLQGQELEVYLKDKEAEKSEKAVAGKADEKEGERTKIKRDNTKVILNKRDREAPVITVAAVDLDTMDEDESEAAEETECLIEGFELDNTAPFPLFPDEDDLEKTLQTDEYGYIIDLQKLDPSSNRELNQALASEAAAEREPSDEEDDADVPTKIERRNVTLQVRALVEQVFLDGRSDSQSVQTMLTQMAPRSCVIVRGSQDVKSRLAAGLVSDLEGLNANVFVPDISETIRVELGPARSVTISDALYQSMVLHPIGDVDMGWIDAEVAPDNSLVPASGGQRLGGVFIGDVKLTQLKRALAKAQIAAEFHEGGLYCQGDVFIKRQGGTDSGLAIEGGLSDDYYRIREIVYGQYSLL